MGRRLFLLLIACLIGVASFPQSLLATDTIEISEPDFQAVETVVLSDLKTVNSQKTATQKTANTDVKLVAPKVVTPAKITPVRTAPVYPANNISINNKVLEIIDVNNTTYDAGNHVNRYGGKFLYGHNSSTVFSGLANVKVGNTFSVTTNGATLNYQVANIVIFEKNVSSGKLQLNGTGSYMNAVANAVHLGVHYDLSIMTCAGTSYGNGDASRRLVLFANAV